MREDILIIRFFKRVGYLIEYWWTRFIDYKYKKSIFSILLKWFSISLIAELGKIGFDFIFDDVYEIIKFNFGTNWELLARIILDGILGGFTIGYSWVSIIIKVYLITLFAILEHKKRNDGNVDRQFILKNILFWKWNWNVLIDINAEFNLLKVVHNYSNLEWEPTNEWFSDINRTYRLNKNKFIKELHVESKLEKKLFNQIVNEQDKVSEYQESFKKCGSAIIKLRSEINELNILIEDTKDPLILSDKSDLFFYYSNIVESISTIDEQLNLISVLSDIRSNQHVVIQKIYFPISSSELNDYINSYSFDLLKVKTRLNSSDKVSVRRRIFNAFSPILFTIKNLNESIIDLNIKKNQIIRNHFIVHATAGVGKTYFAAHIYSSLKENGDLPLFIPASALSGNHSNLSHAFQKVFKYAETTSLNSFFFKLNGFAEKKKKRVVIIIDGLNETTYNLNGFSHIWRDGINNLTEDISIYNNLTFLATCRTSYLENNIDPTFSLNCSHKLLGFEDFVVRKKAINQYFKYYNIESIDINSRNSRLFSTPLILRIYCISENGDRAGLINVTLDHNSYEETLYRFIKEECMDVAEKLDRPSTTPIYRGIFRSSEEFLQEISASLDYDNFLELMQGKSIDDILKSTSVGNKFLDSELVFMKDLQPYFKGERVVHTFQNVGGYLISQLLHGKYSNPADFVSSSEFTALLSGIKKDRVYGKLNKEAHQLGLDIMLFMVYKYSKNSDSNYINDLLDYTQDPLVLEYSWRFVLDYWGANASIRLQRKLRELATNLNSWNGLFENNIDQYLDDQSPLNFEYIKEFLFQITPSLVELTWTKNIYERSKEFQDFLAKDYTIYDKEKLKIALELTIWLLESTSHNLRDEATAKLLEHGVTDPNFIFIKIEEYSNKGRLYIYERLAGIAYGICLQKQNDHSFVINDLKVIAQIAYDLQFSSEPIAPSYHYIVIDSFKHIIDLAIHLKVFEIPERELERFNKYKFRTTKAWSVIDDNDRSKVSLNWSSSPDPDPLSGDFVVYTIPRLLNRNHDGQLDAVAHIYKHLLDSGYEPKVYGDLPEGIEREFYFGVKKSETKGKIDRLGKKYSWNAFYEYAGFLLNSGQLPVFQKDSHDTSVSGYYDRLSDVKIEVSNPIKNDINKRIYSTDLFRERTNSPEWTYIEQFKTLDEVFSYQFESKDFTLLSGFYEESEKSKFSIEVRSFLMVESFLVKKEDILGKEHQISDRTMNWDHDLHTSGSISNTYFGELYWADSIPDMKIGRESIPSNLTQEVTPSHIPEGLTRLERKLAVERAAKGKQIVPIQIPFDVEPAVVEYSWETDSEVYPSLRGNIPSPNIGKHLNLKSDAKNFHILDEKLERAFISIDYEEDSILKQESDYIRTDLLKKYLDDKGLVLMYQIKQHTFDRNAGDGTGDFRGMQFKILEL
ncbi:hypothetical protein [Cellulophaga baltica]|uniref:hypothetical protein n=1 Tax=Cellulophaga baltica TaxID=76594 RepID=UPI0024947AFE|nr:hypothetical protein [Cellulophaga baltica]